MLRQVKFKRKGRYYVYIVECRDGTYYTGYTPGIKKRIQLYNAGRGAKYTRDRRPVKLVWCKEYRYYKNALHAERNIKKLTRAQKEELIRIYEKSKN
ncbi:MAG: GIY-YIG nuclease family protein [Candidatus Omnitrophica bacterium]|nr:GIY-YIG nuclease family protein [Candidatus Omnitrophota bacterium]